MANPPGWTGYAKTLLLTAGGLVAALYLFVALVDPYDNVPFSPPMERPMMDDNQRFLFPGLVRRGRFDSAVFGTSTARRFQPARLNGLFGGRFANLAINGATAWEQSQIADLFLRTVPAPRTLIFALDHVWCLANADNERLTYGPFPTWMYDDDRWNDLPYLLNGKAVKTAGRLVLHHLGRLPPYLDSDGFRSRVRSDAKWDRATAEAKIWTGRKRTIVPIEPPYRPDEAERQGWRFPALAWLEELLGRLPAGTQPILVLMPAHVAAQPQPGSAAAAREQECKDRIARIGAAHGALVADFRLPSRVTIDDANYWDQLHLRAGIADWIEQSLAQIVRDPADATDGTWRVLAAPSTGRIVGRPAI